MVDNAHEVVGIEELVAAANEAAPAVGQVLEPAGLTPPELVGAVAVIAELMPDSSEAEPINPFAADVADAVSQLLSHRSKFSIGVIASIVGGEEGLTREEFEQVKAAMNTDERIYYKKGGIYAPVLRSETRSTQPIAERPQPSSIKKPKKYTPKEPIDVDELVELAISNYAADTGTVSVNSLLKVLTKLGRPRLDQAGLRQFAEKVRTHPDIITNEIGRLEVVPRTIESERVIVVDSFEQMMRSWAMTRPDKGETKLRNTRGRRRVHHSRTINMQDHGGFTDTSLPETESN